MLSISYPFPLVNHNGNLLLVLGEVYTQSTLRGCILVVICQLEGIGNGDKMLSVAGRTTDSHWL